MIIEVPELFQKYNIVYTEEFVQSMYTTAERPFPKKQRKSKNRTADKEEVVSRYKVEQLDYKKTVQRAEKWILPKVRYLTAKEIKKLERDAGKDYRRGYLTQGVFTREVFILVLEYLEQIPKIPLQEDVLYEGLADFLLGDWTSEEKETFVYTGKKNSGIWV